MTALAAATPTASAADQTKSTRPKKNPTRRPNHLPPTKKRPNKPVNFVVHWGKRYWRQELLSSDFTIFHDTTATTPTDFRKSFQRSRGN
jgi:hypothetical protein